ncbi:MAG: hypothetical protein ABSC57_00870 [Syntrophales bacterium]
MDKELFRKFVESNKAFFSKKKNPVNKYRGSILVDLQSNNIFVVSLIMKISSVVSRLLGYDLVALSAIRTNAVLKDVINSYGPERIINSGLLIVYGCLRRFREIIKTTVKIKTGVDLVSLKIDNFHVGFHIYDAVLRRFRLATIDRMNLYHKFSTIAYLSYFYGLLHYIDQEHVRYAILPDNAYRAGLFFEILIQRMIPSITGIDINGISMHKYESPEDYKHHCRKPDDELARNILYNPTIYARAENYLAYRTSGHEKHHDTMRAYSKSKEEVARSQLITTYNLDPKKKIVLIMAHIFCDAPHAFPKILFRDFKHWLINTCLKLAKNPHINFLTKDHPSAILYNEEGTLKRILDEHGFGDRIISQEINTKSLIHSVDVMVTCGGTAGMEFPCYGVPVLVGAKPSYSTFPYIVCPETEDDYYAELDRIHEYKRLSDEMMRMARVVLYIIQSVMKVEKGEIGLGSQEFYLGCSFDIDLFMKEMIEDCQDGSAYANLASIMEKFLIGDYRNLIDEKKLMFS